MERRYEARLKEMLAQTKVSPEQFADMMDRLETFVEPFVASLAEPEQRQHTVEYLRGLLSKLERKTGEAIAYLHDQERQGIQKFVGYVPWDHRPVLMTLARQVGAELGEPDGVLVFDPSGFSKKGNKSVGVARQWCGRAGKIENCQVAVYMAYASRTEHAIVNTRLYLPEHWAKDRARRKAAGVPKAIKFRNRYELALEMLDEQGSLLPHSWIAGDDEMGRPAAFRLRLRGRGERYLLAVPSNTLVRDLEAPPPEYSGWGRRRKHPFLRADRWCAALDEARWRKIDVRDGEKGPLIVEAVKCRVQTRTDRGSPGPDEVLFITRELQDGTIKHNYYLSNAGPEIEVQEFARVAKAEHRIEECLERAKGEAGLADYQVRTWMAWHHHQTLALLATWFLIEEARRGKNQDPRTDFSAIEATDRWGDRGTPQCQHAGTAGPSGDALVEAKRGGAVLSSPCA